MKIRLGATEAQGNSRHSHQGVLHLVLGFKEAFVRLWLYNQSLRASWKCLPIPWLHGLPTEDERFWNWTSSQVCDKNRLQNWWITTAQYHIYAVLPFFGLQSNHMLIGPITHCYGVLRFIVGLQDDQCLPSHSGWGLAVIQVLLLFISSELRLAIPAAILCLTASASLLFYDQRLCLSRRMWVHHLPSRKSVCAKEDRIFR